MSNGADPYAAFASPSQEAPQQPKEDEYASFASAPEQEEAGIMETAGTFAGVASHTAIKTGAVIGGAAAGAGYGSPLGPVGVAAGTILGGAFGYFASDVATGITDEYGLTISPDDIEKLPADLRASAYAGEVFGGAAAFTGAPYAMAKAGIKPGTTMVGKWLDGVMKSATLNKGAFLAGEASMATGSSVAVGIAEEIAPGNFGVRMGAEIAGGLFNIGKHIMDGSRYAIHKVKNLASLWSDDAQLSVAGKFLRDTLEQYGEDPVLVARMLRESGLPGLDPTAAQKVGSPTLGAIERALGEKSANFAHTSKRTAEDSLQGLRDMIRLLHSSGDPGALKAAAELRQIRFKTLLSGMLKDAEKTAIDSASQITGDSQAMRSELSRVAYESVDTVLKQSRQAESELWGLVPNNLNVNVSGIKLRYEQLAEELLLEARATRLPKIATDFLQRVEKTGRLSNVKEALQFRSEMLALAREADIAGNSENARIAGNLAEAALDDMDVAFNKIASLSGDSEMLDAYDNARKFSRELNDTFTRSFAGKATASGRFGDRIPPELMLRKAMATGKEAGALQLKELEEATRFMATRGLTDEASVKTMLDAQERLLRLTADNTVDAETGRVSTKVLAEYMKDNGELLDRFPEVKLDLEKALSSERARKRMEKMVKKTSTLLDQKTAWAKLAGGDPVVVAGKAIASMDPESSLKGIIKVAKRGGEDALSGLRSSVFDAAIHKATPLNNPLQIDQLQRILFDTAVPGRLSVVDTMLKHGAVSSEQVNSMKDLFKAAAKIKTARDPGIAVDVTEDVAGVLSDLIVGGVGASVATSAATAVGSKRILMIQAGGAKAMRSIVNRLPAKKVQEVLIQAMNDPDFAAMLIENAPSAEKQLAKIHRVHAYMIQSGIISAEESEERMTPPPSVSPAAMSAL